MAKASRDSQLWTNTKPMHGVQKMELGVLQTIDVALRAGNGIHRPTIVDKSYSSHEKEKEQCFSLCSKLLSLPL